MAEVYKKSNERKLWRSAYRACLDKYPMILLCLTEHIAAATKQEYLKRLIRKDFLIAELQRQI